MSDMDLPLAVRMMQDGYLMEIDQLQAENAELRKERDALDHLTDVLNDSNDGLLYENAKLRELVRESVRFERYGCYGCSREDTCGAQGIYDEECVRRHGIEQSMRELGLEV